MPTAAGKVTIRAPHPVELAETRALMIGVIERDYGYGYDPRWHHDLDDLHGYYLDRPRHTLFVAVDDATGAIVGAVGVRTFAITAPPHPEAVVARYDRERSAELVRVFVHQDYRRRGLARSLIEAARRWVADEGGYDVICFHSEFAIPFWRALGSTEVFVQRPGSGDGATYFELTVP